MDSKMEESIYVPDIDYKTDRAVRDIFMRRLDQRDEPSSDESTDRSVESRGQEDSYLFSDGEISDVDTGEQSPLAVRMESPSGSIDSGCHLEIESRSKCSSATYFEALSIKDLKAILDSLQAQNWEHNGEEDSVQLTTDGWSASADGNNCQANPADGVTSDVPLVRRIVDSNDCKIKRELAYKVKLLWAVLNADASGEFGKKPQTTSPLGSTGNTTTTTRASRFDRQTSHKLKTYSLHKITDTNALPFSSYEYSRFKYGCKTTARMYGYALADGYIEYFKKNPITQQIVVASSAYCFIPTAAFAMKEYFVQRLNEYLASVSLSVVQETKVHRTMSYRNDYGCLNAQERIELISNDGFHIDKTFLKNKTIMVLDDIRITGSHERVMENMYRRNGLDCDYVFVYFAELDNHDVHPAIENQLNHVFVKSLTDLYEIIRNDNMILNTRVVKFILNSEQEEFMAFVNCMKPEFVSTIYHSAIGNSYHLVEEYKDKMSYLKSFKESALT